MLSRAARSTRPSDAKLHKMVLQDFKPEFALRWAVKDVDLALSEAGDDPPPLLAALSPHWHAAVAAGHGREDVSIAGAVLRPHGTPAQPTSR
jgi:3-hydroxyisobutyrate dehydrogenase